jgi:hypothetical protein
MLVLSLLISREGNIMVVLSLSITREGEYHGGLIITDKPREYNGGLIITDKPGEIVVVLSLLISQVKFDLIDPLLNPRHL